MGWVWVVSPGCGALNCSVGNHAGSKTGHMAHCSGPHASLGESYFSSVYSFHNFFPPFSL